VITKNGINLQQIINNCFPCSIGEVIAQDISGVADHITVLLQAYGLRHSQGLHDLW
jgi:hypothetical protein